MQARRCTHSVLVKSPAMCVNSSLSLFLFPVEKDRVTDRRGPNKFVAYRSALTRSSLRACRLDSGAPFRLGVL